MDRNSLKREKGKEMNWTGRKRMKAIARERKRESYKFPLGDRFDMVLISEV